MSPRHTYELLTEPSLAGDVERLHEAAAALAAKGAGSVDQWFVLESFSSVRRCAECHRRQPDGYACRVNEVDGRHWQVFVRTFVEPGSHGTNGRWAAVEVAMVDLHDPSLRWTEVPR